MGLRWYCISLQWSTYTIDPFWVHGEVQPKSEYPLLKTYFAKGSLLGIAVGEDRKQVLKLFPVALSKHEMGLVFGFPFLR